MPNGSDRITSHPLQELQPTKVIDDPEIKAWLSLGTKTKKKGGGKKKKGQHFRNLLFVFIISSKLAYTLLSVTLFILTGKKAEKSDLSADAEPMDEATNGSAEPSQE